jgi:hypothetical protein
MDVFSKFIVSAEKMLSKLQKFVFSATLTYSSTSKKNKKDNFGKVPNLESLPSCILQVKPDIRDLFSIELVCLDTLLKKVGLHEKSKVIDLTRKGLTVESLTESKLMCSVEDKVRYWVICCIV